MRNLTAGWFHAHLGNAALTGNAGDAYRVIAA
jgi:hypothetical protein